MKSRVFLIRAVNNGLKGPDSWGEKRWIIYDDMSVDYTLTYAVANIKKTLNFNISREKFDIIMFDLESVRYDQTQVNALDGETWEFVKYENGAENWKRDLGYIYGIAPLENIAELLRILPVNVENNEIQQ